MRHVLLFIAIVCMSAMVGAWADDVTGADRILCSSNQATVCYVDGDCEVGPPWQWGVPQFIEIDFATKKLSTTKASHETRETPFKNQERSEGLIFLQGVENGRAFSIVIEEATGLLSAAVARDHVTVSIFGACTPAPSSR